MKTTLFCAALAVATLTAQAADNDAGLLQETWVIKASFLENPPPQPSGTVVPLARVPAMEFMVHVNACEKGITRLLRHGTGHITMEQKVCIRKDPRTHQVMASGWLMTPEIIRDVQRPNGSRVDMAGLEFGQIFDIQTNGTFVAARFGAYDVEITRVFPSTTAMRN